MWWENLVEQKKRAHLTIQEIANRSGVPVGTLNKIFSGETQDPKLGTIKSIARAIGCKVSDIVDDPQNSPVEKRCASSAKLSELHPEEQLYIKKYRTLDGHGKKMVNWVIDEECRRVAEITATRKASKTMSDEELIEMIVYNDAAAAGSPLYVESDYERLDFPTSSIPRGADFGVRINGKSMEPTIEDGSIVWVRQQETLEHDEIGIFHTDDGAVCKRYIETENGVELHSDNPDYPDITGSALNGLRCFGKVLLDEKT